MATTVNIGTVANDGTGDSIRVGGGKINDAFEAITAGVVAPGTVTTGMLADGSVTAVKLASTAITDKLGYTPFNAAGVSVYGATLIDDASASAARTTLELGTAAVANTGTSAGNIPVLDGSAKMPAVDGSALTNVVGQVSPWEISGCEPVRINANVVEIQPGGAANSYNDPSEFLRLIAATQVNLTVSGINGIDNGVTPSTDDDIFFYLVKHTTNGTVGVVASRSISYGGVTYPSGYSSAKARKLPWGAKYKSSGIQAFHYWKGFTRYTEVDDSGSWEPTGASNVDTAGAWTTIDLNKFIPDNARLALLHVRTDYVSALGDSRVRPGSGSSSAGIVCSYVNSASVRQWAEVWCQTNSTRQIQIKTTSGVKIWVAVAGYMQSEYS